MGIIPEASASHGNTSARSVRGFEIVEEVTQFRLLGPQVSDVLSREIPLQWDLLDPHSEMFKTPRVSQGCWS